MADALTHQVVVNLPAVEELQHAMNENIDAQLEKYYDKGKRQVVLHILDFNTIERWKTNLWPIAVEAGRRAFRVGNEESTGIHLLKTNPRHDHTS